MKPTIFAVAAIACTLVGCANNAGREQVGAGIRVTMATQVMNPGAASDLDPVAGLDGKAAKSGYDAYQKSFTAPTPQQNQLTIGLGGSSGR